MKFVLSIVMLIILLPNLFGQDWRDSLDLARKHYKENSYEESYRLYRSAKKIAPKEFDLSDEVAQSAYKAGKYKEAEKIYQQSSSLKGSAIQKASVHRQIGNAQLKQENYDGAIYSYKQALRENPADDYARYNLAESMRKQKRKQAEDDKKAKERESKEQSQKQDSPKNEESKDSKQDSKSNSIDSKQKETKEESEQANSQKRAKEQKSSKAKNQLSDKKTERMLDKLTKQEMETKKRLQGRRGTGNQQKSGKDW